MLQDIAGSEEARSAVTTELLSIEKTKQRSSIVVPSELPECYFTKLQSPQLKVSQLSLPDCEQSFQKIVWKQSLWALTRKV